MTPRNGLDVVEEGLHRLLHRRVGYVAVSREDDRSFGSGAHPAEVLLEDREPGAGIAVWDLYCVTELGAEDARCSL